VIVRVGTASLAGALALVAAPSGARAGDAPLLLVRGQALAIGSGYVVFTSGEALRLRAGVPVPRGTTLGSVVRVVLDRPSGEVVAIELGPGVPREGEVEVTRVPAAYVAGNSTSARGRALDTPTAAAPSSAAVAITLGVTVPANTPPTDDVYVSTDRSNFSPSEIRMQRVSARRFTVSLSLPGTTKLRFEFTRGTYATVERDRSGGIVEPHALQVAAGRWVEHTVVRWADLD